MSATTSSNSRTVLVDWRESVTGPEQVLGGKDQMEHTLELAIHIGLIVLLVAACVFILRFFVPLILRSIIIAISSYPAYGKLCRLLGGHGLLAAVICTAVMLALLIAPTVLLTDTILDGVHSVTAHVSAGTLTIPPLPPSIEHRPILGPPLKAVWNRAGSDLTSVLRSFAPQIKAIVPVLLSVSTSLGLTILQFVFSIFLSGVLLANAQAGATVSRALAKRLFGDKAGEFEVLVGSTIRSVTTGVIGVALIQSLFAGIGLLGIGIAGAGLWTVIFFFAAVLQVGGIVLVPPVVYVFATASTPKALIFFLWCIFVALLDNILKPFLLGRAVAVPLVVVFLGSIGGFMAMGIIGLFIGAIVLSVGYKLFLAWLHPGIAISQTH